MSGSKAISHHMLEISLLFLPYLFKQRTHMNIQIHVQIEMRNENLSIHEFK